MFGIGNAADELEDEAASVGEIEQAGEAWIVERVAGVIGVEAYARHVENFVAAAEVFFPIGQCGIDRAEGNELRLCNAGQTSSRTRAHVGEARVDCGDVFVEEAVEAANPGLGDA